MTDEQRRRIDDHRPAVGLQWDENNPPPRTPIERPEQWTILLTSGNHGLVGSYGHTFPHAEGDHERINVVDEAVVIKLRERVRELEAAGNTNKAVLTDEQIIAALGTITHEVPNRLPPGWLKFARAIEAAVLANASKAVVAEELVRFCPHCASIGEVGAEYRDCCPDGSAARHIPRRLAEVCRDTFKLAIHGAAPAPADNPNTESDIEWAARHLMPFSGKKAADNPSTAGAAKSVGKVVAMPGSGGGFTMCAFNSSDVPVGAELYLAAPALNPSDVPSPWISVDEGLPSGRYCLATYRDRAGKLRIIRAMYVRQYEVEATGDECDSEYNEADDRDYLKAGWLECIDNWGEYSSVYVVEGPVTHWMPLPAAPVDIKGAAAQSVEGGDRG